MPKVKHPEITLQLERSVRSGKYGNFLPPVRSLAREFGVALQTMHKALRPLRDSGLLAPGPGGTRNCGVTPRRDNIGVVTAFMLNGKNDSADPMRDPLLVSLREEAERDGVSLVTMQAENSVIFRRTRFWEGRATDGYIFLYSSFYPVLSRHLNVSGTPFVVGNWLPDEVAAPWADFDWRRQLFDLVRQLREHGVKRIGYLPEVNWDFGVPFHEDLWHDVCDFYHLTNELPREALQWNLPEAVKWYMKQPGGLPDVLLPMKDVPEKALELLDRNGAPCRVLTSSARNLSHPRLLRWNNNDYTVLGKELWKLFRQVCTDMMQTPPVKLIYTRPQIEFNEKTNV